MTVSVCDGTSPNAFFQSPPERVDSRSSIQHFRIGAPDGTRPGRPIEKALEGRLSFGGVRSRDNSLPAGASVFRRAGPLIVRHGAGRGHEQDES